MRKRLVVTRRNWTLEAEPSFSDSEVPAPRPQQTVLLVEDDVEMRRMLSAALRRDGYAVLEAADGAEALEQLGTLIFERRSRSALALIVSDVRLPLFSGFEILEAVRLARCRVPVILITAFGDDETHAKALRLGADCVIDKPFDLDVFRATVQGSLPV